MAMAKIYVTWIKERGFDINRVPSLWREQVDKMLAEGKVN